MAKACRTALIGAAVGGFYMPAAFACTGADTTDERIFESREMAAVVDYFYETHGKSVSIVKILRSESNVLDIDEKVLFRAECHANYIHVYIEGSSARDLRCMTIFEATKEGGLVVEEREIPFACEIDGAEADLVIVPFD